jgi:hypothetical protein
MFCLRLDKVKSEIPSDDECGQVLFLLSAFFLLVLYSILTGLIFARYVLRVARNGVSKVGRGKIGHLVQKSRVGDTRGMRDMTA